MAHLNSITSQNVLSGTIVRTIHEAFDDAVLTLERERGPFPPAALGRLRASVARRIVYLARHGVCDFEHLRDGALEDIRFDA